MGIFQQQFNSLLGSALRTNIAKSVDTYINPKQEETKQEVANDTAQAAKNPLHPEYDKTVETVADYQTKVDVMSPEHETAGNILGMQEQAK